MSTRLLSGAPNILDQESVVESEGDSELDAYDVAVYAKTAGTIKLSRNPVANREHLLVASGGAITVGGNGHPIVGPAVVSLGSSIRYAFSEDQGSWIAEIGAAGVGPSGPPGPVGPAGSTGPVGPSGPPGTVNIPTPNQGVLYRLAGAVGTSQNVAISSDGGGDLCTGVGLGLVATSGQIRASCGGIDGAGFDLKVMNGTGDANLLALSVYNMTFGILGPKNVFNIGGYGDPSNAPNLRVDYLTPVSDGTAYVIASTTPTPQGSLNGVGFSVWTKAGPIPGYNERRAWTVDRHANFIILGIYSFLADPELLLGMVEGGFGWGYVEARPTVPPVLGITGYAYAATGDVHYLKADGETRSWFGDGTVLEYTFPGDADQTLSFDDSLNDMLLVQNGVTTQKRKITSAKGARRSSRMFLENENAFDIDFAWATGTAVTVSAGKWALITVKGGNAYVFATG